MHFQKKILIRDTCLFANEVITRIRNQRSGKKLVVLKVDMGKAYDRVNWKFLEMILLQVGILIKLAALVKQCIIMVRH